MNTRERKMHSEIAAAFAAAGLLPQRRRARRPYRCGGRAFQTIKAARWEQAWWRKYASTDVNILDAATGQIVE